MRHTATNLTAVTMFAVGIALALTGCGAALAPASSDTSAGTSVPIPETVEPASDPLQDVVALVVRPESLELNDESGATLLAVSYDAPAAEMVDALTVAIGAAPEVRKDAGGLETPPGVQYVWPGLTVVDSEPADGTFPGLTNLHVSVSAAAVGEIESIATIQGYRVGMETAPILDENGWTVQEFGMFHFPAEFGTELGASSGDNPDHPNAWAVAISAEPSESAITQIFAPTNFGVQGH